MENQVQKAYSDECPSNIVLYGKPNVGKTSTLQLLIILLCGGGKLDANVYQSFHKTFLSNKKNKDIKVVINYRGATIYVSTMGDVWSTVRANLDFFKNKRKYRVHYYCSEGFVEYEEKGLPKGQILVSAVRDDNSQTGSMHAMRILNATAMGKWQRELWVQKMGCGKNGEPLEADFPFTKPFFKSDYDLALKMVKYIDQLIDGDTL